MDRNEAQHADKQMLWYKEQLHFPTQYYKTHDYSYIKYKPVLENSTLLLQALKHFVKYGNGLLSLKSFTSG
jgi:hypothetical protein